MSPLGELAITGLGASTAVGRTAASSAAAIRAGIARPRELLEPAVVDEATHELVPLIGYPVRGVTDGFVLFARWLRMAELAVADLIRTLPPEACTPTAWQGTALLLAVPAADPDVFLAEPNQFYLGVRDQVGNALLEELRLPIAPAHMEIAPYGHIAFAVAVARARSRIGVDCQRVLVVAVDSLIDGLLLENLMADERLKHAGNPVGLAPGEAAVAILLERSRPERRPHVVVRGASVDATPRDIYGAADGSLARVCIAALADAGIPGLAGDIYLDLTGETWRARRWGEAMPALQRQFRGTVILPAASVGDTGAASGALGACLAARSFARGYAGSRDAAVISMGDDGSSACLVLSSASEHPAA